MEPRNPERNPEREARQAAAMREALKMIEAEEAAKATRAAPAKPKPPAGWYAHPTMAETQRYWDGNRWTDNIAPKSPSEPGPPKQQSQIFSALLIAGSVIGIVMSMQSASLLTGTGAIWTGAAIAVGAAVVTWMINGVPTWVSVVCVLAALLAIGNAVYVESQLEQKRQEIENMFN